MNERFEIPKGLVQGKVWLESWKKYDVSKDTQEEWQERYESWCLELGIWKKWYENETPKWEWVGNWAMPFKKEEGREAEDKKLKWKAKQGWEEGLWSWPEEFQEKMMIAMWEVESSLKAKHPKIKHDWIVRWWETALEKGKVRLLQRVMHRLDQMSDSKVWEIQREECWWQQLTYWTPEELRWNINDEMVQEESREEGAWFQWHGWLQLQSEEWKKRGRWSVDLRRGGSKALGWSELDNLWRSEGWKGWESGTSALHPIGYYENKKISTDRGDLIWWRTGQGKWWNDTNLKTPLDQWLEGHDKLWKIKEDQNGIQGIPIERTKPDIDWALVGFYPDEKDEVAWSRWGAWVEAKSINKITAVRDVRQRIVDLWRDGKKRGLTQDQSSRLKQWLTLIEAGFVGGVRGWEIRMWQDSRWTKKSPQKESICPIDGNRYPWRKKWIATGLDVYTMNRTGSVLHHIWSTNPEHYPDGALEPCRKELWVEGLKKNWWSWEDRLAGWGLSGFSDEGGFHEEERLVGMLPEAEEKEAIIQRAQWIRAGWSIESWIWKIGAWRECQERMQEELKEKTPEEWIREKEVKWHDCGGWMGVLSSNVNPARYGDGQAGALNKKEVLNMLEPFKKAWIGGVLKNQEIDWGWSWVLSRDVVMVQEWQHWMESAKEWMLTQEKSRIEQWRVSVEQELKRVEAIEALSQEDQESYALRWGLIGFEYNSQSHTTLSLRRGPGLRTKMTHQQMDERMSIWKHGMLSLSLGLVLHESAAKEEEDPVKEIRKSLRL